MFLGSADTVVDIDDACVSRYIICKKEKDGKKKRERGVFVCLFAFGLHRII